MDYEIFYSEYLQLSEKLKTQLSNQQKLLKKLNSIMDKGDFKSAAKIFASTDESIADCEKTFSEIQTHIESVDTGEYLSSGAFANQLERMCHEADINISGEGTSFEVFPFRLKIDPQNTEILINNKKTAGMRPRVIANTLIKDRDKLLSSSFAPAQYAAELAASYDLALIASAKGKPPVPDADIYLTTLYKFMTPLRRFRKEYNMQSFAFDLARLYDADSIEIPDGRRFQFGPSRDNSKAIRIVDMSGNEQFLATIRFYTV